MQELDALLLELGRAILTLRMEQSHAESMVNAGLAVYISLRLGLILSWFNHKFSNVLVLLVHFPLELFNQLLGLQEDLLVQEMCQEISNIHIHVSGIFLSVSRNWKRPFCFYLKMIIRFVQLSKLLPRIKEAVQLTQLTQHLSKRL